jgi:hypothetical protein
MNKCLNKLSQDLKLQDPAKPKNNESGFSQPASNSGSGFSNSNSGLGNSSGLGSSQGASGLSNASSSPYKGNASDDDEGPSMNLQGTSYNQSSGTSSNCLSSQDIAEANQAGMVCEVTSSTAGLSGAKDQSPVGVQGKKDGTQMQLNVSAKLNLAFSSEKTTASEDDGSVIGYMLSSGLWSMAYGMGKAHALECAATKKTELSGADARLILNDIERNICNGQITNLIQKARLTSIVVNAEKIDTSGISNLLCGSIAPIDAAK